MQAEPVFFGQDFPVIDKEGMLRSACGLVSVQGVRMHLFYLLSFSSSCLF